MAPPMITDCIGIAHVRAERGASPRKYVPSRNSSHAKSEYHHATSAPQPTHVHTWARPAFLPHPLSSSGTSWFGQFPAPAQLAIDCPGTCPTRGEYESCARPLAIGDATRLRSQSADLDA